MLNTYIDQVSWIISLFDFLLLPYFFFILVPDNYDTKKYYSLFLQYNSKQARTTNDHKNRISDKDKSALTICVLILVYIYLYPKHLYRNSFGIRFFMYKLSFDVDNNVGDAENMIHKKKRKTNTKKEKVILLLLNFQINIYPKYPRIRHLTSISSF